MKYMRSSQDEQRDFLAELASMAHFLEQSFDSLPTSELTRNGANGNFSPIEHVWRLTTGLRRAHPTAAAGGLPATRGFCRRPYCARRPIQEPVLESGYCGISQHARG
jgi:hypothetical protein